MDNIPKGKGLDFNRKPKIPTELNPTPTPEVKTPVRLNLMDYVNMVLLALKNTLAEKAGIIEVEKKSLFQVIIEFITEILKVYRGKL